MAMTMTLAFDGQAIALTEAETRSVLRLIRELRDRVYADDDMSETRRQLHNTVELIIHEHTGAPRDAIDVDIDEDASTITTRRAPSADG